VWTLTAMKAKLKVTLAQLRNGRYAFRPGF
jgi:hypothetical protein